MRRALTLAAVLLAAPLSGAGARTVGYNYVIRSGKTSSTTAAGRVASPAPVLSGCCDGGGEAPVIPPAPRPGDGYAPGYAASADNSGAPFLQRTSRGLVRNVLVGPSGAVVSRAPVVQLSLPSRQEIELRGLMEADRAYRKWLEEKE